MSMVRHRKVAVLLASSLLMTGWMTPGYAETTKEVKPPAVQGKTGKGVEVAKVSKDQALELAKKAIPIPEGFVQRNIEFQSNWWSSQSPAWIIYWDKQTPPYYGNLQIAVDGNTGKIVNIDLYHNTNQKSTYPPKVDVSKAKDIALAYVEKHFPEKAKSLILDDRFLNMAKPPLNGFVEYPVVFKQSVNGIPFDGNEIRVTVNGEGEIVNLGYRWNEAIQFPAVGNILSLEEARKIYQDQLQLSLKMLPQWGPNSDRKMNLGYVPRAMNEVEQGIIRASDGKWLTMWGDEITPDDTALIPIADKKLGELSNGKITQEKALDIVRGHFPIPADDQAVRVSFRENDGQNPVWEFNWEAQKDGMTGWSSASVDAATGRILHYSQDNIVYAKPETGSKTGGQARITQADAEKKAIELMKKLHPDLAHQIYLQKLPRMPYQDVNARFVPVQFVRQVNGVSLEYGGVSVNIDVFTGEVANYWFDVQNLSLPEAKPQVIDRQEALKTYMDKVQLQLMYMVPQPKPVVKAGETAASNQAMLVYQARLQEFNGPYYLDAQTGKWTNRETGEVLVEAGQVTDIQGHPAEKELQLLVKYNVFDVQDNKIKPDEEITRGEMIKMLVLLENGGNPVWFDTSRPATFKDVPKGSPYFSFVEHAVERNLIDRRENFNPQEKIDREELAALIVKALGFEHLAKITDLFNNRLQDSSAIENLGAAILVTKLGIMDTKEGKFLPDGKVTRADAAVAFYRYLGKRNELRN